MEKHIKIYMEAMGYDEFDTCQPCELCGRCRNDVHHIDSRGMGGDPQGLKDVIENLMGLCRNCHEEYGDKKKYLNMLTMKHIEFYRKRRERLDNNKEFQLIT